MKILGGIVAIMFTVSGCGGSNSIGSSTDLVPGLEFAESEGIRECANSVNNNLSYEEFANAWGEAAAEIDGAGMTPDEKDQIRESTVSTTLSLGLDDIFLATPPGGQKNYLDIVCREPINNDYVNAQFNGGYSGITLLVDGYVQCMAQQILGPSGSNVQGAESAFRSIGVNIEDLDPTERETVLNFDDAFSGKRIATWDHLCPQLTPVDAGR